MHFIMKFVNIYPVGRFALLLSHLPVFAPDEIRELTFRDERAEVVVKKLRAKCFIIVVRYGRTYITGRMASTSNPGTVAIFDDIEACVMVAIELSPKQRVFFDLI